jgi:deferrochelatase/peroxidase EfeB
MAMSQGAPDLGPDDLSDIQSSLVGFSKRYERVMFVRFRDLPSGRRFMAGMSAHVNHAAEGDGGDRDAGQRRAASDDGSSEQTSRVSLALSFLGLVAVGAEGTSTFPQEFRRGMRSRASIIGDVGPSEPEHWLAPFADVALSVHAMVTIAADSRALLDARTLAVATVIRDSRVAEVEPRQDGGTRHPPFADWGYFGCEEFHCPPRIAGLSAATEGEAIPIDEVLLGYTDQDGVVSGSAVPQPDRDPIAGQPGYPGPTPIDPQPLAPWTRNGSFVAYRRLRQDVARFRQLTIAEGSPHANAAKDTLAVAGQREDSPRVVYRWTSYGSEFSADEPPHPAAGAVPAGQDRGVLFLCYQSSISRGFEHFQRMLKSEPAYSAAQACMTMTGGEYFFAPSISAIKLLGE